MTAQIARCLFTTTPLRHQRKAEEEPAMSPRPPDLTSLIDRRKRRLWFIDDVFVIWKGSGESFSNFVNSLNINDFGLSFTFEWDRFKLPFLDVLIERSADGSLGTSVHRKSTATNSLLRWESGHPQALKRGIPKGQYMRMRRNCSDDNNFLRQSHDLRNRFHVRGYPDRILKNAFNEVKKKERTELLIPAPIKKDTFSGMRFITTFNNGAKELRQILNKHWSILKMDKDVGDSLPPFPQITFQRGRSIKDQLVRSHFSEPQPHTWLTSTVTGCHRCSGCVACKNIEVGKTFKSTDKSETFEIRSFISCRSEGVIYRAICDCDLIYVGKTIRELRRRVGEHLRDIVKKRETPLARHINSVHGGDTSTVKFMGIEKVTKPTRGGDWDKIILQHETSQPKYSPVYTDMYIRRMVVTHAACVPGSLRMSMTHRYESEVRVLHWNTEVHLTQTVVGGGLGVQRILDGRNLIHGTLTLTWGTHFSMLQRHIWPWVAELHKKAETVNQDPRSPVLSEATAKPDPMDGEVERTPEGTISDLTVCTALCQITDLTCNAAAFTVPALSRLCEATSLPAGPGSAAILDPGLEEAGREVRPSQQCDDIALLRGAQGSPQGAPSLREASLYRRHIAIIFDRGVPGVNVPGAVRDRSWHIVPDASCDKQLTPGRDRRRSPRERRRSRWTYHPVRGHGGPPHLDGIQHISNPRFTPFFTSVGHAWTGGSAAAGYIYELFLRLKLLPPVVMNGTSAGSVHGLPLVVVSGAAASEFPSTEWGMTENLSPDLQLYVMKACQAAYTEAMQRSRYQQQAQTSFPTGQQAPAQHQWHQVTTTTGH
ncbi:unnamed protein product [Ranitomeya imitator]|uniref:Helix-turn-helix domain-containing protein n=1 Tax=Ranitomeya imitator TaxID=111125 RepID=A0ABN9LCH6_9NEOB|nr:unnamed protein product [Ranitomeya imitator]